MRSGKLILCAYKGGCIVPIPTALHEDKPRLILFHFVPPLDVIEVRENDLALM